MATSGTYTHGDFDTLVIDLFKSDVNNLVLKMMDAVTGSCLGKVRLDLRDREVLERDEKIVFYEAYELEVNDTAELSQREHSKSGKVPLR